MLFAALDLIDESNEYVPADVSEATHLLQDVRDAWHRELKRLDALLEQEPAPEVVSSLDLGELLDQQIPSGTWSCDPDALTRAIRHANKALGRTPFRDHRTSIALVEGTLQLSLTNGFTSEGIGSDRPAVAFAGDLDAALLEAEARLAGVAVTAGMDSHGAHLVITISATSV